MDPLGRSGDPEALEFLQRAEKDATDRNVTRRWGTGTPKLTQPSPTNCPTQSNQSRYTVPYFSHMFPRRVCLSKYYKEHMQLKRQR